VSSHPHTTGNTGLGLHWRLCQEGKETAAVPASGKQQLGKKLSPGQSHIPGELAHPSLPGEPHGRSFQISLICDMSPSWQQTCSPEPRTHPSLSACLRGVVIPRSRIGSCSLQVRKPQPTWSRSGPRAPPATVPGQEACGFLLALCPGTSLLRWDAATPTPTAPATAAGAAPFTSQTWGHTGPVPCDALVIAHGRSARSPTAMRNIGDLTSQSLTATTVCSWVILSHVCVRCMDFF